tara:strand:+ start:371 stop:862 length:492 start_codon:yes stop_codon:yes gene_type:complete
MIVLVLLVLLFSAINVFGAACPTGGGCIANCNTKTEGSCANYYEIVPVTGGGKACKWTGGTCDQVTTCSAKCTMGLGCTSGYRAQIAICIGLSSNASCYKYYSTAIGDNFCYYKGGGGCDDTAACIIPEFFGIDFGEMEISTGIIALIAAIALPTLLFRKKKK